MLPPGLEALKAYQLYSLVTYSYTDASIQCRLLNQSSYCLGGVELCFKSTECPTADDEFLTLYPTNFTVPDDAGLFAL
jgi:hypothetical protein